MNKFQIYLGIQGDSRVYNSSTSIPGNYSGIINAGPFKFLQFLETHLGLAGNFPTMQSRVINLKNGLDSIKSEPGFLFQSSYDNDPLGVAKRLLNLWDTWRICGWELNEKNVLPPRMKMIASFSKIFRDAGSGEPDRLLTIIDSLQNGHQLPPFSIKLIDDVSGFPHLYRVIFTLLEKWIEMGIVDIKEKDLTDLGKLKMVLSGKKIRNDQKKLLNDGSLFILHFPDDIQVASAIFSIRQKVGWNPLLVSEDNGLLNGLTLRQGKPVCDWQVSGGNGQILQLFFLATALFKRPLNTTEVIAFLSAPLLPFSKKLARQLAELFSSKPGILNEEWIKCITEYKKEIKDDSNAKQQGTAVSFWLENNHKLKDGTFSAKMLNEIYSTLMKWASKMANMPSIDINSQQELLQLSDLCKDLMDALDPDGPFISEAKLERLKTQLFSESIYTVRDAEVGCSNVVNNPGNVWTLSEETLWMNAIRKESTAISSNWFTKEKDFFQKNNLTVPDNSNAYKVDSDGIKRMILNTTGRFVMVVPAKYHGNKAYTPYCLDEWKEQLDLTSVTHNCNDILHNIPWSQKVTLVSNYTPIEFPKPVPYITIPKGNYTRETESFTSLEKLIQHPMQWFFDYQLRLKHAEGISSPAEDSLRGTIADMVVQKLFTTENLSSKKWWKNEKEFEKEVSKTLEATLQKEGAPFLEDSNKRSLIEYRKILIQSLSNLKEFILENDFKIEGTQYPCEGRLDGQKISGSIDLILKRKNKSFIIDLKWSLSIKKYIERMKEGKDLQLSLYSKMLPGAAGSGYFLLNGGMLLVRKPLPDISDNGVYAIEGNEGVSTENTLAAAQKSIHFRMRELRNGKLESGYHNPLEEIALEYFEKQEAENLYELDESDGKKKAPYDGDLNLFFGLTI